MARLGMDGFGQAGEVKRVRGQSVADQAPAAIPFGSAVSYAGMARGTRWVPQAEAGRHVVYLILEGHAQYVFVDLEGREASAGIVGPGGAIVHRESELPGGPEAYMLALDDVRCCLVPEERLGDLAAASPQAAGELMRALARRCDALKSQAADRALADVRTRLLRSLVRMAQEVGVTEGRWHRLALPLRHQDWANLIGACRETVTTTLADLTREGIVRQGRCSLAVDVLRAREVLEVECAHAATAPRRTAAARPAANAARRRQPAGRVLAHRVHGPRGSRPTTVA